MIHTFVPELDTSAGRVAHIPSVQEIHDEPMLFDSGWDFAWASGGPLTRKAMTTVSRGSMELPPGYHAIIDTRCHMLMKGMYPAIPGWHGDCYPRNLVTRQPELVEDPSIEHYTAVLSTDSYGVSCTEFRTAPITIDVDAARVWASVDAVVNASEPRARVFQPDGDVYRFNQPTLHRVSPARVNGWRFFFRLSVLPREPKNQIRRQVQVYTALGAGW